MERKIKTTYQLVLKRPRLRKIIYIYIKHYGKTIITYSMISEYSSSKSRFKTYFHHPYGKF